MRALWWWTTPLLRMWRWRSQRMQKDACPRLLRTAPATLFPSDSWWAGTARGEQSRFALWPSPGTAALSFHQPATNKCWVQDLNFTGQHLSQFQWKGRTKWFPPYSCLQLNANSFVALKTDLFKLISLYKPIGLFHSSGSHCLMSSIPPWSISNWFSYPIMHNMSVGQSLKKRGKKLIDGNLGNGNAGELRTRRVNRCEVQRDDEI